MDVSFGVSMMLRSVNNMGPGIQSALRQVEGLRRSLSGLSRNITTTVHIRRVEETVRNLRNQSQNLQSSAMHDGTTGAALMAPIVKTAVDFAQAEDSLTDLKIAAYDSSIPLEKMQEELKKASEEAKRLGDVTRFSTKDAYDGMTTLVKGGADIKDVYSGLGQASIYLAQAGKVPVDQSAEAMVKISNAYGLSGEKMKEVADMISRVDGASTASIYSLQMGFKYASGTAAQLGQSVNETAQALAVLNNRGLDESTAGTNYADMLQRLIPQTKQQTAYMAKLGWIGDNGKSVFMDAETGKVKDMASVIGIMRESLKGMRADDQMKYLHKVFGEQGGRAAMALMQGGKGSWEEVGANIAKAISLDDRIAEQSKTLKGRFENMMGSLQNLSADSGSPIGTFVSERLDGITESINATRKWAEANPEVVKGIMWIVTSLGMLKLGTMVFKLMRSAILGSAADVMSVWKWILKLGGGIGNLKAGFDLIRATGAGFWRSLWQGAQLAWPWLGKISGWVARFAPSFLATAARVAAGWLIAMGPLGWITIALLAAIAAWETNFMGFRDTVKEVHESVMGWLKGIIDKMYELLGLKTKVADIEKGTKEMGHQAPGGVADTSYNDETPMVPTYGADNTPLVDGGSGSDTFSPKVTITNNVSVNSAEEAGEYVAGSVPDKYLRSRDPAFGGV